MSFLAYTWRISWLGSSAIEPGFRRQLAWNVRLGAPTKDYLSVDVISRTNADMKDVMICSSSCINGIKTGQRVSYVW